MPNLKTCELCGKVKNINGMTEYYLAKRTDSHNVMYKCKNGCKDEFQQPEKL